MDMPGATAPGAGDAAWRPLYKAGAVTALLAAGVIPLQSLVFMAWPPRSTALGWFQLFLSLGSVAFLLVWNVLIARRLFTLSREQVP